MMSVATYEDMRREVRRARKRDDVLRCMAPPLCHPLMTLHSAGAPAWTPASLASLRSWYDSSASALQTDKQGVNNYSVVGSPTHGSQNSLTTTIFNGSSDRLNIASFSLGTTTAITVYGAFKVISSDATSRQIVAFSNGVQQYILGTSNGKANINNGGASEIAGAVTVSGAWKRIGYTNTSGASNQKLYVNGVLDASQSGGGQADPIAGQVANYFQFCNVEIAEFVICSAVLSSADLASLDSYLSTRWAI